jgi:hypothetical protein
LERENIIRNHIKPIAMAEITIQDVDERIHDKMEGPLARIEASIDIININIGNIEKHLETANHATAKNVEKIEQVKEKVNDLEKTIPHSVVNCPQNGTLIELKTFFENFKGRKEGVNEAKDKLMKVKSERRAEAIKWITAIGVIVAALALLVNLTFSILGYHREARIIQDEHPIVNTK